VPTRILLIAIAALTVAAAPALGAPRAQRLAGVHSFALAIGSGGLHGDLARRYRGYDLVVVDGQEATARDVAALPSGGAASGG
jgi:hypothetical protein